MKYLFKPLLFALTTILLFSCNVAEKKSDKTTTSWATGKSGEYEYSYVENDPSQSRFYTLENGLTVILSPSQKEPRIQTYFAVKAGSKTDPADHTGLAHYLEHMLFKGTDKFGSLDYEQEKPLLDEIEELYEKYNSTTDETLRKEIYSEIDRVSGEAAKFAIANEYDKMMSGMGATGTNAFTSVEQTVYTEDIPSNVIDKYLAVQAERFRNPVFRIFHTELEAVYEEKNRSLDSDGSKVFEEMFKNLFPNNNYGKQTTIGTIEHLKNPSLKEIRKYFETYYVPNNMAMVMAGDFDPDEVIVKIADAFDYMEYKELPEYTFEPEVDISEPVVSNVYGPEPARIMLGYRFPGASSEDAQILELIGSVLTNGAAGLMDLNLVKKQELLSAYAFPYVLQDYSTLLLMGNPTEGQSLDEVRSLLLGEIDKLKSGDFSDELLSAIVNNAKKDVLEITEDYGDRAYLLMDNFVLGTDWIDKVNYVEKLSSITKEDIIDFANRYFDENYVAVYKHQGEDENAKQVEKPEITPVEVNRDAQSDFLIEIAEMPENEIKPVWIDYSKDISKSMAGEYEVLSVKNESNDLFDLTYYYETGSWSNKLLSIASDYLEYLGTEDKTAEDISRDFYSLASQFYIYVSTESTSISLSGLQENFEETVQMFDDLLENCIADQEALDAYIMRIKQNRQNRKDNKNQIAFGLRNYAMYGERNPFKHVLSDEELDNLKAEDLVAVLRDLANYKHKILYYGPKSSKDIAAVLEEIHPSPSEFIELPAKVSFEQIDQEENEVLITHYDMVQAEIYWIRNSGLYSDDLVPIVSLFNQYFGSGMESIVFQTIRESKALAYSTYAYYSSPRKKEYRNSFTAYVGTQADKFSDAVDGMNELLNELPKSDKAVENAKKNLQKVLASDRILGRSILAHYLNDLNMGRDFDIRKNTYNTVPSMDYNNLQAFFEAEVKDKPYTYCIVAGEGKISQSKLNELGKVKVLTLEDVFGY